MVVKAENCLIQVGLGRGFVVADTRGPQWPARIITCAHCIPEMPPAHPMSYADDRTFRLLGPLFEKKPRIHTEVLFYDPIIDVAVLGEPDIQAVEGAEAYEKLVTKNTCLHIAAPPRRGKGFVYDLRGTARKITYESDGIHFIVTAGYPFLGGMSGSPVLDSRGRAIAIVSIGRGDGETKDLLAPCLSSAIPARINVRITTIKRTTA